MFECLSVMLVDVGVILTDVQVSVSLYNGTHNGLEARGILVTR